MIRDLRAAFEIDNLRRAWRWLNTNPDAQYKSYFRNIYRAYAISHDDNLRDLHNRLRREVYQPTHAAKLYLPKKSGLQRTYTLLTVEDQIVYQALVNIVADRLLPKVRHRYYKEVFGHLYAGKRSRFFYRDWRKGYQRFGSAIRQVYTRGFVYTASFDLTACYDSIDHTVLSHFLTQLGLQKEFSQRLCEYLRHWTANPAEKRIYQGHGIPQGPLSSGLLSETVLSHFDEDRPSKPRSWRYFRYVDDIRFFAKREPDLREMLVEMDLLSKRLGLFPQSGKVAIHRIANIADEIKSVSRPPEPTAMMPAPNQNRIQQRLKQLSPRYKVSNETRFKFVLGVAEPSSALSDRLIQILRLQPHLYISIFNYFGRYLQIPIRTYRDLARLLRANGLYPAFVAAGLRAIRGRVNPTCLLDLQKTAGEIIAAPRGKRNPELFAAAMSVMLPDGRLPWADVVRLLTRGEDWWSRADTLPHVQITHLGRPSYESLVNQLLTDASTDVGLVAAEALSVNALGISVSVGKINPVVQLALKAMGYIRVRRGGLCALSMAMGQMLGPGVKMIDWKSLFGNHYKYNIGKAVRLRAYSEGDATAWVNLLDTFHDDLLDSLFAQEAGALGTYVHGNLGGVFSGPNCRFCKKYPLTYRTFGEIHKKRLESILSHSVTRSTGKRTRFIEYEYIDKTKPKLAMAYSEIWALCP